MAPHELHMAYTSELAPGQPYTTFATICQVARRHNARHGIAGVLLFDGLRFFQWLHGPVGPVAELMARIAVDPRHVQFSMVLEAKLPPAGGASLSLWRSGFVEAEAMDPLIQVIAQPAEALLAAIHRLVESADLDPLVVRVVPSRPTGMPPGED